MKNRKVILMLFSVFVILINLSISGKLNFINNNSLNSLLFSITNAQAETSSGCSMCGSGDSTCRVSCDGGVNWTTCPDVKGIEVLN